MAERPPPEVAMRTHRLSMVSASLTVMVLGLASCADEATIPTIPDGITSIVPAAGADISTGTQFNVSVDYMIPSMDPDLGYRIDVNFEAQGGSAIVTEIRGSTDITFTFTASPLMIFPYELKATLFEEHPSYDYVVEHSATKKYY